MIVKVTSYIKRGRARNQIAKTTVRYLMHRPNERGERGARTLFGSDGPITKEQAYRLVDSASRKSVFFRIAISPDPKREDPNKDLALWPLTQESVRELSEMLAKDLTFIAAEHSDQGPVRHVNLLLIVPQRLTKREFRALPRVLREKARELALTQRALRDAQTRKGLRLERQTRALRPPTSADLRSRFSQNPRLKRLYLYREPRPACPSCGNQTLIQKKSTSEYKCLRCGERFDRNLSRPLTSRTFSLEL